mmetsp:Transcript_25455/g.35706  ORF Transcript_25455/g.35706 Transcript_25455/m.35706 type:complete len:500 (-) Transcript_25455:92-1591(-)
MDCSALGAKGIDTFTESISRKYLPKESSLEYEGLFFDYFFETANESEKLFKAKFNYAVTNDPLSNEKEFYVSIGMASCLDGDGLKKRGGRPLLNLVIVLDISGSMDDTFYGESKSKLGVSKDNILALMSHLVDDDQFSLITFNTEYQVMQEPQLWKNIDQSKLKQQLMNQETSGGTSLVAGIQGATKMLETMVSKQPQLTDPSRYYESRIMYLTDMCPTTNDRDGAQLFKLAEQNAQRKIYTTFIGIGVDFNTDIVALIGKIRACNYFSVKSAKDFKKTMDDDFEYIVTPSVFDISIQVDEQSLQEWQPIRVFGSPGHEIPEKGLLTFVDSSFPSQKQSDTQTKGGVVLVKLKKLSSQKSSELKFVVTYKDRYGQVYQDKDSLKIEDHSGDFFETISIRKTILLTRYVNFFKSYLADVRTDRDSKPSMSTSVGIPIPQVTRDNSSYAMRMKPLTAEYQLIFKSFIEYYTKEMSVIEDTQLDRELQPLITISTFSNEMDL